MGNFLNLKVIIAFVLAGSMLCGCARRGVEVYSVEKETVEETPAEVTAPAVKLPSVAPENWAPAEIAGGPRVASFQVAAEEEGADPADMAVTVFPGDVGGLLANVNRWRGEVSQGNITEAELETATERIEVGGHTIHLVDGANEERRTLGAILPVTAETWFFKLSGPKAVVAANRDAFRAYVEAVEFASKPAPPPSPESLEEPVNQPELRYQVPDSWVEGESTSMRVASFTVTGGEGREADIGVIPLGGTGGAQLAIINQWRATLRLENATEEQLPEMVETIEVGGREFQLVNFESDEAMLDGDQKARILVAYGVGGEHTWFFKMAGETSLVTEQKPILLEFLKSLEFDAP
jgi:hypothetical protein